MLEFKRGTIIDAKYELGEVGSIIDQTLIISDTDGNEYETYWKSYNSEEIFGERDKVSFLLYDGVIIRLRLNPFGAILA